MVICLNQNGSDAQVLNEQKLLSVRAYSGVRAHQFIPGVMYRAEKNNYTHFNSLLLFNKECWVHK